MQTHKSATVRGVRANATGAGFFAAGLQGGERKASPQEGYI